MRFFIFLTLFLLPFAVYGQDSEALSYLEKIDKYFQNMQYVGARFAQNNTAKNALDSVGYVEIMPGRSRWLYQRPYNIEIKIEGSAVTYTDYDLKTHKFFEIKNSVLLEFLNGENLSNLKNNFVIYDFQKSDVENMFEIHLKKKKTSKEVIKVSFWISPFKINYIEMKDPSSRKNRMRVTFYDVEYR